LTSAVDVLGGKHSVKPICSGSDGQENNLFEKKKWNTLRRNLEVGDLVLLADKSFPMGK